jgi:benzoyl-CoA 2,3-dioxygenase component B
VEQAPALNALNERLRDDFIQDSVSGDGRVRDWLPTPEDRVFVQSLMGRVVKPGKFANWISPPTSGINGQAVDCEYVRFN